MSKVHVLCCVIQGHEAKRKFSHYFELTRCCIDSLLHTGFPASNVTCIAENKRHCDILSKAFGINAIHGPPIPKEYGKTVSKRGSRKLFFYKPISYSLLVPKPINQSTMIMVDVDSLFIRNPESFCDIECDVWSQESFRYLRPSRVRRFNKKSYVNPRLDNIEELSGYFGSESQAYLFKEYKCSNLPEMRITSNLVAIKPGIYDNLIRTWKEMSDLIIKEKPSICKGDQEILSSAIDYLGLDFRSGGMGGDFTEHYSSGKKVPMIKKWKAK